MRLTQTLTDLNDYLGPSQVCIKPVEARAPEADAAETQISIEDGVYVESAVDEPRVRTQLQTAQISLNDCLACSGCVTSAETVLIGQQSIAEVRAELEKKRDSTFVMTISAQTWASLQAAYDLTLPVLRPQVEQALTRLGFDVVQDMTAARDMALHEHVREFRERRTAQAQGAEKMLPMLASACPGWVCYAEKAHSELLPLIATAKSPQQMAGLLAKRTRALPHAAAQDTAATRVYHVAVMPCYDKKLEAARPDFADGNGTHDVDCVLTTGELHDLLHEHGFEPAADVPGVSGAAPAPVPGTSSGGYLFAVLLDTFGAWRRAHPADPSPVLETRTIRSADYTEYVLRAHDDTIVFKGAACYGFRNLQNLVRKLQRAPGIKPNKARGAMMRRAQDERMYDYVEVMACPGGCVNGGGQMRPPPGWAEAQAAAADADAEASSALPPVQGWQGSDRRWVEVVERAYWLEAPERRATSDATQALLEQGYEGALQQVLAARDRDARTLCSQFAAAELRTSYHGVEANTNGLAVQW